MARGVNGIHSLVADLVADHPTAVMVLLEQHVDDGHGHCRTCTIGGQRGNQTWPCTIHAAAALAARRMARLARPRGSMHPSRPDARPATAEPRPSRAP